MTAVGDVWARIEPIRMDKPNSRPTTTSRNRDLLVGPNPTMAAGRIPTANANPLLGSPMRITKTAGSVQMAQRMACDQVQLIPGCNVVPVSMPPVSPDVTQWLAWRGHRAHRATVDRAARHAAQARVNPGRKHRVEPAT